MLSYTQHRKKDKIAMFSNETPHDRHAQIVALREQADQKWIEFKRAKEKESGIWDFQIAELFDLVPEGCSQIEAEKVFLEKYAASYDAALKDSHRLYDEWIALVNQCDALMKQERAELERELENAGK